MTYEDAVAVVKSIRAGRNGEVAGHYISQPNRELALAVVVEALVTRVQNLEAKTQGPELLKPLSDKLGDV